MYHFVNFRAYSKTLNSTYIEILKQYDLRNTENSKITDIKVHKLVHFVS